ncbi:MAG: hypothetical protein JXA71_00020, partial [Chitinispirillaceae bacterium]|nr:hypothetical protein [Chitinispirillaceae bacterium]
MTDRSPFACLVLACTLMTAATVVSQNTLSLNVGQATHTINRAIYGALMEDWGRCIYNGVYVGKNSSIPNTSGMRNDVIAAFKEAGISCLEWPGGCYAEVYRWRDGIGASRPGGDMTNGLGTNEYFQLCQLVGSAPYICCNMSTAPASESREWLNYGDSLYPN